MTCRIRRTARQDDRSAGPQRVWPQAIACPGLLQASVAQRPPHRLLVEERRRRILDLVRTRERLTVGELVKHFGVSPVTARGDLDACGDRRNRTLARRGV